MPATRMAREKRQVRRRAAAGTATFEILICLQAAVNAHVIK
jgi:hypothetical protein